APCLCPETHLPVGAEGVLAAGLQALLALECLDLLDGDLELMGDPGVRTPLAHPPADLVKLRTQGPSAHRAPQTSNTRLVARVQALWRGRRRGAKLASASRGAMERASRPLGGNWWQGGGG